MSGWVDFALNKWKIKRWQITEVAVCPGSVIDRIKRSGRRNKKYYSASKCRTWLLTQPSTKNFFSLHRHHCFIWIFCRSLSLIYLKRDPEYLTRERWNFCSRAWFRGTFSFVWGTFFFSFISFCLMCVHLQYPHVLVILLFSVHFDSFMIWVFYFFCSVFYHLSL